MPERKRKQTKTVKHRTARKLLIQFHFQNTSPTMAMELIEQASTLPGTTVGSVEHSIVAYSLGPSGIPWASIFISVKPYAYAAGLYISKKVTDLLFELAKDWLKSRNTKQPRKVYILGPDKKVVRCLQINGAEPEDITENVVGRAIELPFEGWRR